jgi:hypothetical protein
MITSTHTFTDGNGNRFSVQLVVDQEGVARHLSNTARRNGRERASAIYGGVTAIVTPA